MYTPYDQMVVFAIGCVCCALLVASVVLYLFFRSRKSSAPSASAHQRPRSERESIYYESSYYKITQTPYLEMLEDDGKRGEYELSRKLAGFEQKGARLLFNLYIPLKSGGGK